MDQFLTGYITKTKKSPLLKTTVDLYAKGPDKLEEKKKRMYMLIYTPYHHMEDKLGWASDPIYSIHQLLICPTSQHLIVSTRHSLPAAPVGLLSLVKMCAPQAYMTPRHMKPHRGALLRQEQDMRRRRFCLVTTPHFQGVDLLASFTVTSGP